MYLGVDVGGTKTLLAVLNEHGEIRESRKFPTPQNYHHFLLELAHSVEFLATKDFKGAGVGIPGTVDRVHGQGRRFGNLPWHDVPIERDIHKIFKSPVVVENDAKLAALSEAMLVRQEYSRVLYVTISTGIGIGLVVNGVIDTLLGDTGGHAMFFEHKGGLASWESFASGRAIVERFGKKAQDITDDATWKIISRDLAMGFLELIALTEPEVIIVGGSVGNYFSRFKKFLQAELKKYETPIVKLPVLCQAQRPEEAVVYGCYDLAKMTFNKQGTHGKAA